MGLRRKITTTKYLILLGITIIAATLFADILILSELKASYADTELIISGIAGNGESGDTLLQWQKEFPNQSWLLTGEQHMAAHGYDIHTKTIWDKSYDLAKNKILLFSVSIDSILLILLYALFCIIQKQNALQSAELEKILGQIQNTDSPKPIFPSEFLNTKLQDRISSLWEQIQTDHNRLTQEKEETKALVTDISHQLKTPVAALKTNIELLITEKMTDSEQQEFLYNCVGQLESLENLTKTLVNVSRLEKGMVQLHIEPTAIDDTILSAVNRIYEKASEKCISIELTKKSLPEKIIVPHDKKWTAEVFINLLDNAIKYSGRDSHIEISIEPLTTYIRINFKDEGIGISKSEYHKIFQRFYRSDSVGAIEGSGVGLYLARKIIEEQNGTIYVHARSDGKSGSIFSVQLPKMCQYTRLKSLTKL